MTGPAFLSPGAVLRGRYEIVREIGRGGYSIVYLARDRELGSNVALKLLSPPPSAAHLARERMRREVQAVRGLSHANIVAVFDFLEEEPWSFVVMEYVAGPDLQIRVRERGPLDGTDAARLGRDIAGALAAAHRRGILHRDVKPQNILLDPDGRARLTDFGSARLDSLAGVTATGALAGTLVYTAPEVLAGQRGDARADVYALGLTLYFAVTGSLPGRASSHLPPTPSPDGYRPPAPVPDWLGQVIARATAEAPERRFATAAALDDELRREGTAAPLPDEAAPGSSCALCAGPDPLGLGLCLACGGGSPGVADTLVYLRPNGGSSRRETVERLGELLSGAVPAAARAAAARGERPLFRVPRESATRVMERLAEHRMDARAVARGQAWRAVPAGFYGMVLVVLLAGYVAGPALPMLLWTSPLFAVLLLYAAVDGARRPLVEGGRGRAALPQPLEREVIATLSELPSGPARSLFADVVRMARPLFARLGREGDPRGIGASLQELTVASAAAAKDLAQLDENLARFERQRDRAPELPPDWLDTLARTERTRDALVQRLLEAMTVVGQLQRGWSEEISAPAEALGDITRELRREAEIQVAVAEEIAGALRSPESGSL